MKLRAWWLVLALLLPVTVTAKDLKVHKGYEGADPPEDQLVHLKVSQDTDRRILFARQGLRIASVDGKSTGNWWDTSIVVDEILLKPGKHRIGYVATSLNGGSAVLGLWFVAEPGKSYATRTEGTQFYVRLWIEDVETGKRVGGIVGSEDEPSDIVGADAPTADAGAATGTEGPPPN